MRSVLPAVPSVRLLVGVVAWLVVAWLVAASAPARAEVPISFYGDTQFGFKKDGETTSAFAVPRLDIFATQNFDRVSFLAEVMFEVGEDNEFHVDVERVEVGLQVTSWLRVRAGRFHTALGYYNDAYHHGAYFLVPTWRPSVVDFEDGGGLIPAHTVGLHADARWTLGSSLRLRVDAEVGNGRPGTLSSVPNLFDVNHGKAVNVRVRFEPLGAVEGLVFGVNAMFDRLTLSPGDGSTLWGTEQIYGAHVAYLEHQVYAIAEGYAFHHTIDARFDGWTLAGFVELGYSFDAFTPYVRGELARLPNGVDPIYDGDTGVGDRTGGAVGVKYTFNDNLAFKLQGDYSRRASSDRLMATLQAAFAF